MRSFPAFRSARLVARVAIVACVVGSCGGDSPTAASPVRTVVVTVEATQILVGASTHATAQLRDADGRPVLSEVAAWSTLTPAVLSVSPTGEIGRAHV